MPRAPLNNTLSRSFSTTVVTPVSTRGAGDDATVWYERSEHWPRNAATTVRAALGTGLLARPQSVRVMYQLKDAAGNTRVSGMQGSGRETRSS